MSQQVRDLEPPPTDVPRGARHYVLTLMSAALVLVLLGIISLGIGTVTLTPGEVLVVLFDTEAPAAHRHIVHGLRLPRMLIAAVAGAMLGLAGALLQTATRNALADPSLLGVTGGAVLAVVATMTFTGRESLPGLTGGLVALGGAFAAGTVVYVLGWSRQVSSVRLILDGVLVSAILSSLVSVLLLLDGALFSAVLRWLVGTLNARVWQEWAMLWPWALVTIPLALLVARSCGGLWLGDDAAAAIGMNVTRIRLGILITATALTGGAVAVVGAIGFIGLLAPNICRLIVGSHPRRVIPLAALVGSCLLLAADICSVLPMLLLPESVAHNRATLPAGAVTAIVGGPVLVALMARRRT